MNRFQSWYGALPRALRVLLTINVVVYVLWFLLFSRIEATAAFVVNHLALNPGLPGVLFEPWQLLTYNFLHLGTDFWGLIHLAFNMLWLYWIGRDHEDLHGPYQITALYLITGIGGGLLTVLLNASFPGVAVFGGTVHGASASVLGVMTAVAVQYPQKKIGLLFIGPVRLIYLVLAFLVLDLLFLAGSNTAVGAHLGGALFGFLFVKVEDKGVDLTSWTRIFFPDRSARHSASGKPEGGVLNRLESWLAARGGERGEVPSARERKRGKSPLARIRTLQTTTEVEELPIENEIDRILDKISEQGMASLTEEERRILHEASRQ